MFPRFQDLQVMRYIVHLRATSPLRTWNVKHRHTLLSVFWGFAHSGAVRVPFHLKVHIGTPAYWVLKRADISLRRTAVRILPSH